MPAVLKLLCLHRRGGADGVEHVVQAVDALIAEADVAAQIPAAEILDHRVARMPAAA